MQLYCLLNDTLFSISQFREDSPLDTLENDSVLYEALRLIIGGLDNVPR